MAGLLGEREQYAYACMEKWGCTDTRVTHCVLQSGYSTTLTILYNHPVYSSFFEETPLTLYTFDHPLKPAVYDTRPRSLGYVLNDTLEECSGIFSALKLLSLQLPFDGKEQNQSQGAKSGEYGGWVTS